MRMLHLVKGLRVRAALKAAASSSSLMCYSSLRRAAVGREPKSLWVLVRGPYGRRPAPA